MKTTDSIARVLTTFQYTSYTQNDNHLRLLLTNVKDKDRPEDRQGAVYTRSNAATARLWRVIRVKINNANFFLDDFRIASLVA